MMPSRDNHGTHSRDLIGVGSIHLTLRIQLSGLNVLIPGIYRIGVCSGTLYGSRSRVSGTSTFVRIKAMSRLPGSARAVMAPTRESAAETPIAGANPILNAWDERKLPTPANTAAWSATPAA